MAEVTAFAEEWVGRNPRTVYAVKVQGTNIEGRKSTYIFLYASKVNYDRAVQQLPKGLIADGDTVTTYVGTVEWEETGQLDPVERVVKMPEPKGKKRRAA